MSKLSVVVSTNKSNFWERFCSALLPTSVELEVIFVGPLDTSTINYLPMPVRFLRSNAKPAQCWEIGSRAATGDLLCMAADDCVFSPGFLDAVLRAALVSTNEFDMFTGRYVHNGVDQFPGMRFMSLQEMPLLPVGGFMRTSGQRKIGGIDKRFTGALWDTDMYQRAYVAGGRTTLLEGYVCHEVNPISNLFVTHHKHDTDLIRSLWYRDGKATMTRSSPVLSYSDDEVKPE